MWIHLHSNERKSYKDLTDSLPGHKDLKQPVCLALQRAKAAYVDKFTLPYLSRDQAQRVKNEMRQSTLFDLSTQGWECIFTGVILQSRNQGVMRDSL